MELHTQEEQFSRRKLKGIHTNNKLIFDDNLENWEENQANIYWYALLSSSKAWRRSKRGRNRSKKQNQGLEVIMQMQKPLGYNKFAKTKSKLLEAQRRSLRGRTGDNEEEGRTGTSEK